MELYRHGIALDGKRYYFFCERAPDETMQTDRYRAAADKATRKIVYRIGRAVDAEPNVVACWSILVELNGHLPDALDALQAVPTDASKQVVVDALNALHPRTPPMIWAVYAVFYRGYMRIFSV